MQLSLNRGQTARWAEACGSMGFTNKTMWPSSMADDRLSQVSDSTIWRVKGDSIFTSSGSFGTLQHHPTVFRMMSISERFGSVGPDAAILKMSTFKVSRVVQKGRPHEEREPQWQRFCNRRYQTSAVEGFGSSVHVRMTEPTSETQSAPESAECLGLNDFSWARVSQSNKSAFNRL